MEVNQNQSTMNPMSREDEPSAWNKCVFYPTMSCPVQESMDRAGFMDVVMTATDEKVNGVKGITPIVMNQKHQRWAVLAPFCMQCPYKKSEDLKTFPAAYRQTGW